jgi:putative membrane-bound dehydrogenase-like protein
MDRAITFAANLDHVNGLLPYNGGLIATTRTQVLFLKDTDGDGKADVTEPLIKGFNPRHAQLQVSSPRWGLDNCVHFNNGLDAKEIYPVVTPAQAGAVAVAGVSDPGGSGHDPRAKLSLPPPGSQTPATGVARANFKWDPRTGQISPTGGPGQFGGAFDDWGHHFYCSNRNPIMFTVMPYEVMARNPHAGITENWENIAPYGADTRVYPLQITHTTADAHAGTNTACCGLGVYRGHLMPELKNNVFVPDPTGQLITRYKIEPNGASLKATRVGERTEFFRSADEWCRPVNFTTGPDGAIYVCDIYRRWIDHARFFPEEFVKKNDMRQGEHEGRIWRVVPRRTGVSPVSGGTGVSPVPSPAGVSPAVTSASEKLEDLIAWLGHENAWQRETAQRLLIEKGQTPTPQSLPEHQARIELGLALGNLHHAEMAALLSMHSNDEWIAKAVALTSHYKAGNALSMLPLDYFDQAAPTKGNALKLLARCVFAQGDGPDADRVACYRNREALFTLLDRSPKGHLAWWKPAVLEGIADGLRISKSSLTAFIAKPPAGMEAAAKEIAALMAQIESTARDPSAPLETRLAVLPLLAQSKWEQVQPVIRELLGPAQPAALNEAAMALLKKFRIGSTEPFLYEVMPSVNAAIKGQLVAMLAANPATALPLLKRMERGELPKALIDIERRWSMQRGKGELVDLAKKLFGQPSEDRAKVLASYADSAKKLGDATRGMAVFQTICIACHKVGDLGMDVGPPLSDVKVKLPEALLSDILDPNRMFEARWAATQIDTHDGRTLSGLVTAETADAVTLTMMGGVKEPMQRSAIKAMKSLDRSLMPVGLEAGITPEQMSDLLAFLLGR